MPEHDTDGTEREWIDRALTLRPDLQQVRIQQMIAEAEIAKAREANPDLKALLVINQLEPRTRLSQAIRTATVELNTPTANTAIRRRVVYRSTVLEGRSVFDAGVKGAPAVAELTDLLQEIGIPREQQ